MDDFDFTNTDSSDRSYLQEAVNTRYERQGFSPPYDRSPVQNLPGWYEGGMVHSGGNIYVRSWLTMPYQELSGPAADGNVEYEIGYGKNPDVSVDRLKYNANLGRYEHDGTIDSVIVERNTDMDKARAAERFMQKYP